jgi:nucleotide-binding universal stress UspA family protein
MVRRACRLKDFPLMAFKMYKHIVVGVSADSSNGALPAAIELARTSGACLTAVHIFEPLPWWAIAGAEHGVGEVFVAISAHAREVVSRANELIREAGIDGQAIEVSLPTCGTTVGRALANTAGRLQADLVVLGAGKKTPWWFWERSLRHDVARHTDCEVFVVGEATPPRGQKSRKSVPLAAPNSAF